MRPIDADELLKRINYKAESGMGKTIAFTFKHFIDDAPTIEAHGDLISRADAIEAMCDNCDWERKCHEDCDQMETIKALPSADAEWIPCSEKMPKELERVNVTWLNHNPPFYYQHIKDIPQTDTAVYYRGKWYWWDVTVIDILAEYGEDCNAEQIDKDIEVIAWQPLPKPYKGGADMRGGEDE